jgi:peptidoglycan hydrolase-like protein with peptidoglycan-binding domain
MKRIILATASVLALGLGGAGLGFAGDTSNYQPKAGSNMPGMTGSSTHTAVNPSAVNPSAVNPSAVNPSRDEIRQAQQQLQSQGLYNGAIDGIIGPETKQALHQFQQQNGLNQTARLDQPTMDRLFGNTGAGQGSTLPQTPGSASTPMTNPPPASPRSNLGNGGTTNR